MGDEGKAVGCVPPTALLFVALAQRSRGILYLSVAMIDRWLILGRGCSSLVVLLNFKGSRDTLASLFLLRDLRAA
jgi:hypothetical protein